MSKNAQLIAAGSAAIAIGAALALGTAYSSIAVNDAMNTADDVTAITVDIPLVNTVGVAAAIATPEKLEKITPETISVDTSKAADSLKVSSVTDDLPRFAQLQRQQQELLTDQRSLKHDPTLGKLDSTSWAKWAKIFIDPTVLGYSPEFKPLQMGLKIISEVRCPRSPEEMTVLAKRLADYRRKKFNAVLLCFDTTEDLIQLAMTADYIKSTGMKIIIVYVGGKESLHAPVFRDPDEIAKFISRLATRADAILTGHWRTSVHLYLPDKAYTNYIIRFARDANPEIGIIGQAYWGQTAATGTEEKNFTTTIALPENSSAVLITGLGYPGAANRNALKQLFAAVADHPHKIGFVVGEKPYFSSTRHTGRSHKFNEALKRQIERQLLKAGFQSTLTFSADGSNRDGSSENLCKEYQPDGGTRL